MTASIRSELLKLRTVRGTWGLVAAALGATALMLALQVLNAGRGGSPSFGTAQSAVNILAAGGIASLVTLVLGILTATSEHRHSTLATTLLATPSPRRVVVAKLVAAGIMGLAIAVLVAAAGVAAGAATGALGVALVNGAVLATVAGLMAVLPLYALVGVGVGLLVRHQTAAVAGALLWALIGESLVSSLGLDWLAPWTPGGAARAIGQDAQLVGVLPAWAGVLLLLGYAAALALVGTRRLLRRDAG